ncbi:MAG: hypothetical protein K1W00_00250 [Lachnospiraceae bacterium]
MQELIGNLTAEQFALLIGKICGVIFGCVLACSSLIAFITAFVDGWAFRKGSLYYGSFKYLNQCFKRLKNCGTVESLVKTYNELNTVILLLMYQRVIPKLIYKRLLEKLNFIFEKREIEISDYWK